MGLCTAGTQRCETGDWTPTCAEEVVPAAETCNGLDEDCDGTADEELTSAFYRDLDGDSFGDPDEVVQACAMPPGYVTSSTDCDDQAAGVRPEAAEQCNGIDEDCDTIPDDGAAATLCPPTTRVQTTQCGGLSGCEIVSCNPGSYDADGQYATGCECDDDLAGSTCSAATHLGSLSSGQTQVRSGKLPDETQTDWYQLSFPAGPGNPTIALTSNPGSVFRFDVLFGGCGGTAGDCVTGGKSTALFTWVHNQTSCTEINYCTTCGTLPASVLIRVERTSTGQSCATYQLSVSR